MKRFTIITLSILALCSLAWADALPSSSQAICDVKTYGARGDGITKDTVAIQAAIDACAESGGSVLLHDGTFLSGMVVLKSGIHLTIEPTATLKGTQDDADYPDTNPPTDNSQLSNCRKALVYAEGAQNIFIEGGGTIDGNGNTPKWLGPASVHPERTRPMAIYIALSSNVTIQDILVKDAAMWAVVNLETDNLVIRNVNVRSNLSGTRDGIDVVDCHNVLIDNCTILSEDDSICLKSATARGTQDVVVQNSHVLQSSVANGLKLGTASTGSFRNVTFQNIEVDHVDKAAMAVESVDGADISGITFQGIHVQDAGTAVFVLLGRRGNPPRIGSIDRVTFQDISGDATKHSWGSIISGTQIDGTIYSPTHLLFRDFQVTAAGGLGTVPAAPPEYDGRYPDPNLWGNVPAAGLFVRHVNGIFFDHSSIYLAAPDARSLTVQDDVH
jgi:polygalacturonase